MQRALLLGCVGGVGLFFAKSKAMKGRGEDIRDGAEGLIGRTPLVRIRSLSEITGCEILGKVCLCVDEVFVID